MKTAWLKYWKNYFNFTGKTNRPDYWWMYLITVIINIIIQLLSEMTHQSALVILLSIVIGLGMLIPSWALLVRRLNDTFFKPVYAIGITLLNHIVGIVFIASIIDFIIHFILPEMHSFGHASLTMVIASGLIWLSLRIAIFIFTLLPSHKDSNQTTSNPTSVFDD